MDIRTDDPARPEAALLLAEHLRCMAQVSPAESRHALGLDGLRGPAITFYTAWVGGELAGCAALKELDPGHSEVKSMRTAAAHLRTGVGWALLAHVVAEAGRRGYRRLSLETGSMAYFEPARRLYLKAGFRPCEPFAAYVADPNNVFLTLELTPRSPAASA